MEFDTLKNKKLLLVDDEQDLLDMVQLILQTEGYTHLKTAGTVREALAAVRAWKPDLALLDVMLPDGDGFSLLEQMRAESDIPVLFLTARGEDEDKFRGLGLGADDYIVKPFLPRELILRVGAVLRRCYPAERADGEGSVRLAACALDFDRAEVVRGGERIPLTATEFKLLRALCRNAGKIVTIDLLCEAVWGDNPYGYENSLMAHIRRIREKIEANPSKPVSLITVKGLGYKLITEGAK
ncbi:MAG: response regulator transcription factor [Clostridia bacterium]